jgi:hypothetical protein
MSHSKEAISTWLQRKLSMEITDGLLQEVKANECAESIHKRLHHEARKNSPEKRN